MKYSLINTRNKLKLTNIIKEIEYFRFPIIQNDVFDDDNFENYLT